MLRRYWSVTQTSFVDIARTLFSYTTDDCEDLPFTGREVSHWVKGERTIPPNKFPVVIAFLFSEEFAQFVPEMRNLLNDEKRTLEAGNLWASLHGISLNSKMNRVLRSIAGYWEGWGSRRYLLPREKPHPLLNEELVEGEWIGRTGYLAVYPCLGHCFTVAHYFSKGEMYSGYIFPDTRKNTPAKIAKEKTKRAQVEQEDRLIFPAYLLLWNRKTRKRIEVNIGIIIYKDTDSGFSHQISNLNEETLEERTASTQSKDRIFLYSENPDFLTEIMCDLAPSSHYLKRVGVENELMPAPEPRAIRDLEFSLENKILFDSIRWSVIPHDYT